MTGSCVVCREPAGLMTVTYGSVEWHIDFLRRAGINRGSEAEDRAIALFEHAEARAHAGDLWYGGRLWWTHPQDPEQIYFATTAWVCEACDAYGGLRARPPGSPGVPWHVQSDMPPRPLARASRGSRAPGAGGMAAGGWS